MERTTHAQRFEILLEAGCRENSLKLICVYKPLLINGLQHASLR